MDVAVGQTVYFTDSIYRRNSGLLLEGEVLKIGRKYITVLGKEIRRETRFDKKTLLEVSEHGAQGILYLSKQDYLDEIEHQRNIRKIENEFKWSNRPKDKVSLETTRRIIAILEEEKS